MESQRVGHDEVTNTFSLPLAQQKHNETLSFVPLSTLVQLINVLNF